MRAIAKGSPYELRQRIGKPADAGKRRSPQSPNASVMGRQLAFAFQSRGGRDRVPWEPPCAPLGSWGLAGIPLPLAGSISMFPIHMSFPAGFPTSVCWRVPNKSGRSVAAASAGLGGGNVIILSFRG